MEEQVIHVQVRLLGYLKQDNHQSSLDLQVKAGSTVSETIHVLSRLQGENFRHSIMVQNGELHGEIEIVVIQEHLPARKIDSIQLFEDCEMVIMPMIEGGSISCFFDKIYRNT